MTGTPDWRKHSAYSDPGRFAPLIRELPDDIGTLAQAARNVIVHYRAELPEFTDARLPEVNSRWLRRILGHDQARFGTPLLEERPQLERVAGCCRDHSLFLTAALREHGVPARNLVGFSPYLIPDWHIDHVITEHHDGERWVRTDPELPAADVSAFQPAAQAWLAFRAGDDDLAHHAVFPDAEGDLAGETLVRRYVLMQLAHRYGDELLLWDAWGSSPLDDAELDEVAEALVAADGSQDVERELHARYVADDRLHPGPTITQYSPLGGDFIEVDLRGAQPD